MHNSIFCENSVCNFQSIKIPVELNSLLMKFFCYVIWFDVEWHLRPCKRGLFVKSCFFKLIPKRFKNYKLNWTAVHRAFQNIVHSSIFRKKQTALHIAFQNIAHRSIFREKQAAMHTAFQNTVHRRFFRQKQTDARVAFQNIVQGRVFFGKTDCRAFNIFKYSYGYKHGYGAYRHGVSFTLSNFVNVRYFSL